jgi:uncharacterized membrane protein YccC
MVPLLLTQTLHLSGGTWASLGGFSAAIADRGGTYRIRALTMGAFTVGGAIAVVVAGLVGAQTGLAVALTFVIVGFLSLAREFGLSAGGVGTSIAVAFAISLSAASPSLNDALLRGAYLLGGGAWAMVLALVLWPLRPYRPLRLAAARAYGDLAEYAAAVAEIAGTEPNAMQRDTLQQHKRAIRESIEAARSVVAVSRRGGQGEVRRGERLLLLVQGADLLFGTLIAISELLESTSGGDAGEIASRVTAALSRFASSATRIANTIEIEAHPPRASQAIAAPPFGASPNGLVAQHATRLLEQLEEYTAVAAVNADAIEGGRPPAIPPALTVLTIVDDRRPVMETLRASLTLDSLAMRHALRVAIVTAVAVLVTRVLGLQRGYWVTITAIIILQPYAGATLVKGLQRVLGTVAGALLTVALVALVQDTRGLLIVVFMLATVCVAYLRVNYLIYSVFLTPTFVLLAEMSAGDWHLAQVRVLNTLIGGALGLAGSWLLWPTPERDRFPELAAQALRAAAAHVRVVVAMWDRTDEESSVALASARRAASLATTNAEASFERLVVESASRRAELEPGTTLLTFTRRLIAADIALGTLRFAPEAAAIGANVARLAEHLTSALDSVAEAVAARRPPAPCAPPSLADAPHADLTLPQFHRVLRQLDIIHAAAARLAVP